MSYLEYFGLRESPFGQAAQSKFYYASRQHQSALQRVYHAIDGMQGLAALVGEIGTGKSMIARKLLFDLPEDEFKALLLVIVHSQLTHKAMLCKIAKQLGGIEANLDRDTDDILGDVFERLIQIQMDERKRTVVIIDEASMLKSEEIRQEFRGLLNLEYNGRKLVTFVFIGMPELDEWLNADPALRQRVACRVQLHSLDPEGVQAYIKHRLTVAGAEEDIFDEKGYTAVAELSTGIPRVINTICDNVLLEAQMQDQKVIDSAMVTQVAQSLGFGDSRLFRRLASA